MCHFIIHSQLIPSFDSAERLKIPPNFCIPMYYFMEVSIVDAATSSGILKEKQKLGVTFNSDKLGGIKETIVGWGSPQET